MIQHQPSIVIMGVAGCGKSSLGAAVAQQIGFKLIEGDDYHSPQSLSKMRQGIALTDADRDGWLASLANALQTQPGRWPSACGKFSGKEALARAVSCCLPDDFTLSILCI